jgi:uncharacterized delta-60 repeat protein
MPAALQQLAVDRVAQPVAVRHRHRQPAARPEHTCDLPQRRLGDGVGVYDLGTGTEQINDLLVLPGGSVVAAGSAENSQRSRFSLLKVGGDGRLDDSFGRGGGATLEDVARGADSANALAIAAGGDYLLAGSSHGDWAIAAFTPGGTPDRTYGNDGHRVLPGTPDFEEAAAIVPFDAKTYVVGTVHGRTDDLGVARLRASGNLDTSFSGDGRYRLDVNGIQECHAPSGCNRQDPAIMREHGTRPAGLQRYGTFQGQRTAITTQNSHALR